MRGLSLLSAAAAMFMASVSAAPPRAAAAKARVYASPQEVYEALCEADARQDYRALFFCLTPEAQAIAVFETFFACHTHRNTEAVLKKYGLEDAAISAEYDKCYYKKHGIDSAKHRAKYDEAMRKASEKASAAGSLELDTSEVPALPRHDDALLIQVVSDLVRDKPGFCEAYHKVVGRSDDPPTRLEAVRIQGDVAVGRNTAFVHSLHRDGRGERRVDTPYPSAIYFRRVQGSWLIDTNDPAVSRR
jgi:hypothetical protein